MRRLILAVALLLATFAQTDAMRPFYGASGGTVQPTWATDQTQEMPYSCPTQTLWINPSASPSEGAGGGAHYPTGTGTQAKPFLSFSDLYASASNVTVSPGTCINLVNSTPDIDDDFDATQLSSASKTGGANSPTGYRVIRSTDGNGNLVTAGGVGVTEATVNSAAATIQEDRPLSIGIMYWAQTTTTSTTSPDFWIIDGLAVKGVGAFTSQSSYPCLQVGNVPLLYNSVIGPSHFQVRNAYITGCGGSGVSFGGVDRAVIQNSVCTKSAGAPGFQESCIDIITAQYPCSPYALNCAPPNTGYDAILGTVLNGSLIQYHTVITGNWCSDAYEFGQAVPPTRTDGNCIIFDTDAMNGVYSSTNAGPYNYPSLVANNLIVHVGGRGVHVFGSGYVDIIGNTVYHTYFDPGDTGTARPNIDCFNSYNCRVFNNVSVSVGANTFVTSAYSGGSTGPVHVDDVRGFLLGSTLVPPSGAAALNVEMQDTTQNTVSGVTVDSTNTSTTPGGISGTLSFTGNIDTENGALNAVFIPNEAGVNFFSNLISMFGGVDSGGSTGTSCQPWVQTTLPCAGGDLLSTSLNSPNNYWQYNLFWQINGGLTTTTFNGPAVVPPTLATSPGFNTQSANPEFTTAAFAITPAYILGAALTKTAGGSGYSAGCNITLAGGSPATAGVVQVDSVSGSAVNTFHTVNNGFYPGQSPTSFTQASATCAGSGATFSSNGFYQPFWMTSYPNMTPQGGSPVIGAGFPSWCLKEDFTGAARACPNAQGAIE